MTKECKPTEHDYKFNRMEGTMEVHVCTKCGAVIKIRR
jgi:hypothetical protein